MKKEVLPDGQA